MCALAEEGRISPRFVELLAAALKCGWGVYWEADTRAHALRPAVVWCGPEAELLKRETLHRTLTEGEGTAGLVWRSGKAFGTNNLICDMCLPRSLEAQSAGYDGGFWFAVREGDTVVGVFEFLGKRLVPVSQELLEELEALGRKLKNPLTLKSNLPGWGAHAS